MRQLFNCRACKHTEAREYTVIRTEMYGPGRMYERRIWGRVNEYGRTVKVADDFIACPKCSKLMSMAIVKGLKSDHICDERCTEAKGHKCECSCGGANHGKSYTVQGVTA